VNQPATNYDNPNPDWWERAIAGLCSHGGHGPDETCDDAPPGYGTVLPGTIERGELT
jgi:hypothetical protein